MTDHPMVVVNGVRYRAEDAERLGLVPAPPSDPTPARSPKKATAVRNKARRPAKEPTRGDDDGS